MRRSSTILVMLLSLFTALTAQQKRETDSLVLSKLYSKLLDEERRIVVHLPLNYEREPNLFHASFCFSTPAWRFDNIVIKRLEESLRIKQSYRKSYLFFSVGENENPNIKASYYTLKDVLTKMKPKGMEWNSHLTPLANHQTNPVLSSAKAMLCWAEFYNAMTNNND